MKHSVIFLIFFAVACSAEVFFREEFDAGWENRWVISTHKGASAGTYVTSAGTYFADENDKGLKTKDDARFYQISAALDRDFSNEGKDLVVQYSVKHEQNIDCGGAYVKLLPKGLDQSDFNGDSAYNIMFGPDICGNTKRTHFILNYKGTNHLIKGDPRAETDALTHLYTMILRPDQTFSILIDNKEVKKGSIAEDWDILPPKKIKDPKASKPADWVDAKKINDPTATKPEGWDDIPAQIVDSSAVKPADWDDELDGTWEPPTIDNPDYKGEWSAPQIANPDYKGEWVHPLIDNPDYETDDKIYAYSSNAFLGIEIWQVRSGTIFDHFLVTDDVELADAEAKKILEGIAVEKEKKKEADLEQKKAAEEAAEADDPDAVDDEVDVESLDDLSAEELKDEL